LKAKGKVTLSPGSDLRIILALRVVLATLYCILTRASRLLRKTPTAAPLALSRN